MTEVEFVATQLAMHYQPTSLELAILHGCDKRVGVIIRFAYRPEPLRLDFNIHGKITRKRLVLVIIYAVEKELQPGG